jgi:N-methylhydantoinase A/oxoprolinase/acetone carboxylase beta subunit
VGAVSPHLIDRDLLVRRGIIARASLTPTDLLHVSGEYAPWDAEIARLAAETAARVWGERPEWLVETVKRWMAEQIAAEIVQFLSGKTLSPQPDPFSEADLGRWLFEENLSRAHPFLGCRLELKLPLVGIGAPARVFLPAAAELLGAQIVFPEHYQVANAVGSVVGNIIVRREAEIVPQAEGGKIIRYTVRAANRQEGFASRAEALEFARQALAEQTADEARAAGAADPALEVEMIEGVEGFARVVVSAVGKPGLPRPARQE